MRLVCPNCDAEYEVDASVIPQSGRDVQCSNCGTAWFQIAPDVEADLRAEEALYEPPPPAVPIPAPLPESEPEPVPQDHIAAAPASGPRRSLDETLLAVLREEAEREQAARMAEGAPLQTQPDLGLPAPPPQIAVARRIAKLKGEPAVTTAAPPVTAPKAQTRRELLPEIEEINSSLRASSERRSGHAAAVSETMDRARGGGGFRSGFMLVMVLALVAVAVYVMAPKLSAQMPAAAGVLERYVLAVDAGRVWLDGMMRWAIGQLRGQMGSA
ncbi:MAG: hypothetical protein A3D16_15660 [Rhodobacterales bacterium RIFCSPHIGHO2_02_FULL_62_130]|nr:MAG: hypothetical protein A3E48_06580 [Rhodobacterales bacterium RIFCSPHIGHO2_12_FULL_62_75]OHC59733.1 MAG: hypothetical protein A3D16_15660 [Rhodobacterales bacterium RIFCSPHIGHO2_02_FULL_62_130]